MLIHMLTCILHPPTAIKDKDKDRVHQVQVHMHMQGINGDTIIHVIHPNLLMRIIIIKVKVKVKDKVVRLLLPVLLLLVVLVLVLVHLEDPMDIMLMLTQDII